MRLVCGGTPNADAVIAGGLLSIGQMASIFGQLACQITWTRIWTGLSSSSNPDNLRVTTDQERNMILPDPPSPLHRFSGLYKKPRSLIDMFEVLTNLEDENENKMAKKEYLSIEQEIDCPRCHGIMTLHFEFDLPGYFCEDCDIALRLTHY